MEMCAGMLMIEAKKRSPKAETSCRRSMIGGIEYPHNI
jgi:hypothetical protein